MVNHSYENKAFKIFIYKLIQDCPENSNIHESLTMDNLFQWSLNAIDEFTYLEIQSDDSASDMQWILERFIPKEFYTNWQFINELFSFEYEHEYEPFIFRLASDYVLKQTPKDGFNTCNIKQLSIILNSF